MKAAQQVMAQGSCHEFLPDATHHKIAAKIYSRLPVSYKIYLNQKFKGAQIANEWGSERNGQAQVGKRTLDGSKTDRYQISPTKSEMPSNFRPFLAPCLQHHQTANNSSHCDW